MPPGASRGVLSLYSMARLGEEQIMVASISAKDHTDFRLRIAMVEFLERASELEHELPEHPRPDDYTAIEKGARVASYVIGTVLTAVAYSEARVNEVYMQCADGKDPPALILAPVHREALGRVWNGWLRPLKTRDQDPSLLQKIERALTELGVTDARSAMPSLDRFELVIELRNALTHAKSEFLQHGVPNPDPDKRLGRLATRLQNEFPPARGMPATTTYIWTRCLGLGCAHWAANSSLRLLADWVYQLQRAIGSAQSVPPTP